jgi:DMSO/TMAO reductase YedYZ molybdopterin-dependent catalytic subunit
MKFMKLSAFVTMLVVLLAALALSGCASPTPSATPAPSVTPAPTATPVPVAVLLTVNGSVTTPLSLTLADLQTYPQLTINESTTNKNNQTQTVAGTGPSLNAILTKASPSAAAKNITFIASDGYAKMILLSVITGSPNATVVVFSDGSLRDVIPGQGSGAWVSNLTAITIS